MLRLLLPLSTLVACTPSPEKAVMPSPNVPSPSMPNAGSISGNIVQGTSATSPQASGPDAQAAHGSIPTPGPIADTPAAALGRRTLSTAFVRIGPDGHLTVERHDGQVLVLRDVTMGPGKYCGMVVSGGAQYCGTYAEVAAARPGGAPVADPAVGPAVGPAARN